ncbi:MAG: hypothetical protein G8345_21100 [Magnetococcales bacterium]|nr:hypothetical protein [Magnetococcales bacterium]
MEFSDCPWGLDSHKQPACSTWSGVNASLEGHPWGELAGDLVHFLDLASWLR